MPEVSVVIPTYRRREPLRQAVQSVLNQNYTDWELHVVDDGSGDGSLDILSDINEPRMHLHRLEMNGGSAYARNFALPHCCGKWIAFLDSDDVWVPDKLSIQMSSLGKWRQTDGIICAHAFVYSDVIDDQFTGYGTTEIEEVEDIGDFLFFRCLGYQTSTWLVSSDCFQRQRFDQAAGRHDDWDLLLRWQQDGYKFAYLPYVLATRTYSGAGRLTFEGGVRSYLEFQSRHGRNLAARSSAGFESHILAWHYLVSGNVIAFIRNAGSVFTRRGLSSGERVRLMMVMAVANWGRLLRQIRKHTFR